MTAFIKPESYSLTIRLFSISSGYL
jgi:hypothetical protein